MNRWLGLWLATLLLVACGGAADEGADAPVAVVEGGTSTYQMIVLTNDLAPGEPRLVLSLWDGPDRVTDIQAMEVELYRIDEAGTAQEQIWSGPAKSYQMGGVQYWVSYPMIAEPGTYGVRALATNGAGQQVENLTVLAVKEETAAPNVGESVPLSENLTLSEVDSIEELTSAPPYHEHFYQMNVGQAATSGKPSIIAFATPGYCTSSICLPVLETVETVSAEVGAAVNVVHVEIWRDFERGEMDPAVVEWEIVNEPWIFVLDEAGQVAARLEGPVSPEELREALAGVLDG